MKNKAVLRYFDNIYMDLHIYDLMDKQEFFACRVISCRLCKSSVKAVYRDKPLVGHETPFIPSVDGWRYYNVLSSWICPNCREDVEKDIETLEPLMEKYSFEIF